MIFLSDVSVEFSRKLGSRDKMKRRRGNKVYRAGRWWTPNVPQSPTVAGKKKAVLAAKKVDGKIEYKLLNFGSKQYGSNYSTKARQNYLKRSAGIKQKDGSETTNDKFSRNYWSRKVLWSRNSKPVGTGRFK